MTAQALPQENPASDETVSDVVTAIAELSDANPVEAAGFEANEVKRALEAALLASSEPISLNELRKLFDGALSAEVLRVLLEEVRADWAKRSVELAIVASGYRFRVNPSYQKYIDKLNNEKPPRYSRAVLETLAIIAYRQPVTRADIEDIRGVQVSPHILKTLEDRGWIDEIGTKDAPGRPALFATTRHFLDDLNLRSLDALPPLHELQATLDLSNAGAALSAADGVSTPDLPGVAESSSQSLLVDSDSDTTIEAASEISSEAQTDMPTDVPTDMPTELPTESKPAASGETP